MDCKSCTGRDWGLVTWLPVEIAVAPFPDMPQENIQGSGIFRDELNLGRGFFNGGFWNNIAVVDPLTPHIWRINVR
jgi:hypothetical protein